MNKEKERPINSLSVKVTGEQLTWLKKIAQEEERTIASVIRRLIKKEMEGEGWQRNAT